MVELKEGINLQDLRDGKGAAFEVNEVKNIPEDNKPFKREEMWEHLSHECLFGTEEGGKENLVSSGVPHQLLKSEHLLPN